MTSGKGRPVAFHNLAANMDRAFTMHGTTLRSTKQRHTRCTQAFKGWKAGAQVSAYSDLSQKEAGIFHLMRSGIYDMAKEARSD